MRYHNARRHHRKAVLLAGVAISTGALVASAFLQTSAAALVATQGAVYGVGGALVCVAEAEAALTSAATTPRKPSFQSGS